jgi:membrane protein implicated in regulation of membrane protease activity
MSTCPSMAHDLDEICSRRREGMMHKQVHWITGLLLLAAAAIILVAAVLDLAQYVNRSSSAEWASWVQAFGAIAGIAAAIWISREDTRQAKHARLEEDRALDHSARQVIGRAKLLVEQIGNGEIWNDLASRSDPSRLADTYKAFTKRNAEEIYAVLAGFPVERLAAVGLIDTVIAVRRAMGEIVAQAEYYNFDSNGRLVGPQRQQFVVVRHMVEDACQRMADLKSRT